MSNPNSTLPCCIVGGGPAGMMLALLLARKGVRVVVLEKHKDFFRDFRGDTVHPSTLEVLKELGILEDFLKIPHTQLTSVGGVLGGFPFKVADYTHLPVPCKFVALMPQWDLLNFLASHARKFTNFDLRMEHEAIDLLKDGQKVTGVKVRTPEGVMQIEADLVIGCDGRHALTRQSSGLQLREFGVPIDVLWFRVSRTGNDPEQLFGNINYGRVLILINRGDYFQAGFIIPKDSFKQIRDTGLPAFRALLTRIAPYLADRVHELQNWDQVKLLSVQINRLVRWYQPGLLCIGDAAHAMSPAGGVGINLAIQDAVATANLLASALRDRRITLDLLDKVQKRREFPTRFTQFLQVRAHRAMATLFQNDGPVPVPWQLKTVIRIPGFQHLMGRVVGLGARPEHVADAAAPSILTKHNRWLRAAVIAGACVALVASANSLRKRQL